ncbi:MAG: DUF5916 domain-containing protein [Acidobacteriota bacterium]|nr:DUF5916 domain-containing protein [Acidobacteriota bacterium]
MRFPLALCLLLALCLAPDTPGQPAPAVKPTAVTATTPATDSAATAAPKKSGSPTLPPEKAQPVRIPRFDSAPVIDGKLDDAVWKSAAVFKDFYQIEPGDNIAPSQPTEVLAGYDAKFLYFAFKAYDEPSKVRATVAKRDSIGNDDTVGILLDTFNDQRKAYQFEFNPFGIQADAIVTEGRGDDESFDLVMESKGALVSDGYVVEIAIPFKSLRYEAGPGKLWGVHFFRVIKRFNNETSSWMPISRDISGNLAQAGKLTGLEGISTERTLEIIPSFTISETGAHVRAVPPPPFPQINSVVDPGRFVNRPIELDFGVTTKFGLTPTVTLDFAYNPDFAQVEADQTVVQANQRFPIFFEEKRPFFLEGKEIFDTSSQVVHTRAIIDPDYAVKLTGKRGRNTFGLILASDNAPGNFSEDERTRALQQEARRQPGELQGNIRFLDKNAYIGVLRLKRDVGRESSVGLFATSYNFIEKHNQLLGFDGRFKLDPKTVTSFEVIGTTSRRFFSDRETGDVRYRTGNAFGYSFVYDYTGRHWGYVFEARGRTRDYRADVGFTRRTNTNNAFFAGRYSTEPNPKAILTSFRLQNFTSSNYDWQARHQNWQNGTNLDFNFTHQTFMRIGLNYSYERLFAEEFGGPGSFFGPDSERSTYAKTIFVIVERTFNKQFSGYFFTGTRRGIFDFDFGAGPRFPRVSPAALRFGPDAPLDPGSGNGFDLETGVTWQPTNALRASLDYTKARLTRRDTGLVAFDDNIYRLRATYQFTRFTFARARVDYDSLATNVRGQFLLGWTPNPGTAFFAGYNDDLNRNGFNPFSSQLEPGFRRNGRTFFIKASYLFRRSF